MNSAKAWIQGLGLGLTGMYLFDPRIGRRRRARLADQTRKFKRESREFMQAAAEDLSQRARGFAIEGRKQLFPTDNQRPDVLQAHWLPGTRLIVGASSAIVLLRGISRRGLFGFAYTLLGAAGLLRAVRNLPMKQAIKWNTASKPSRTREATRASS